MPHMLFYAQTWCFSSRYFSLVVCLCRLCVWGYFKYNLWLQTGALVRCRYLNSAGFLSQTSDFPHTFPLRGLEKKKKDREKCRKGSKASTESNEVDELRRCIVSSRRCPLTGSGGPGRWWRPRGLCLSVCGLLRPPRCLPGSELWKPHRLFVQQKKKNAQLLRTLQNQLALTFTSAFWHFFSDMASTQGRASLRNVIC